jgi:hypothetical protein
MLRRSSLLGSFALLSLALAACEPRNPPIPETWAKNVAPTHQKSATLPPASDEGTGPEGSLLASYADRTPRSDAEMRAGMLPFQAKAMIVELLIAAAKDDPERMTSLLTQNARWGAPDRREPRARPIVTEQDPLGLEFLQAFRNATVRFGKKANFTCPALQPGWQGFAASGAEPVWCSYNSDDKLDIIGVRLIVEAGQVKTDYVGFFPERKAAAIRMVLAGSPPPPTPYIKRQVDLKAPELMPDGSNPVLEKPRRVPVPAAAVDVKDPPMPLPADSKPASQ